MLEECFVAVVQRYTKDSDLVIDLWNELTEMYTSEERYYHSFSHLENMLHQLTEVRSQISNWDTVLFSLYYHDIVYSALNPNNEKASAKLAKSRLGLIGFPQGSIQQCYSQIIATKGHLLSDDADTNFFTDADLSIIGMEWEEYDAYRKGIRKEYHMYPYGLYKMGRIKVLKHFLAMDSIYKTSYFQSKFEEAAQINLKRELSLI